MATKVHMVQRLEEATDGVLLDTTDASIVENGNVEVPGEEGSSMVSQMRGKGRDAMATRVPMYMC